MSLYSSMSVISNFVSSYKYMSNQIVTSLTQFRVLSHRASRTCFISAVLFLLQTETRFYQQTSSVSFLNYFVTSRKNIT